MSSSNPTTTSRPTVIPNGSLIGEHIMSALHGSNELRLRCMHCFCYPEFLLGNKVFNPNAAASMLLWWSKMTIVYV